MEQREEPLHPLSALSFLLPPSAASYPPSTIEGVHPPPSPSPRPWLALLLLIGWRQLGRGGNQHPAGALGLPLTLSCPWISAILRQWKSITAAIFSKLFINLHESNRYNLVSASSFKPAPTFVIVL